MVLTVGGGVISTGLGGGVLAGVELAGGGALATGAAAEGPAHGRTHAHAHHDVHACYKPW